MKEISVECGVLVSRGYNILPALSRNFSWNYCDVSRGKAVLLVFFVAFNRIKSFKLTNDKIAKKAAIYHWPNNCLLSIFLRISCKQGVKVVVNNFTFVERTGLSKWNSLT